MTAAKVYEKFLSESAKWEKALEDYSDKDFVRKPGAESWSIGEVYEHLVTGTLFYQVKQIEKCLSSNENQDKSKTLPAIISFIIKSFPPVKIKVSRSLEYAPKLPKGKESIKKGFDILKIKLKALAIEIDKSENKGKTKHPALGYLNAIEWFQLIEMHYRHHQLQKNRIDKFLKLLRNS